MPSGNKNKNKTPQEGVHVQEANASKSEVQVKLAKTKGSKADSAVQDESKPKDTSPSPDKLHDLPSIVYRSKDGLKLIEAFKDDAICVEDTVLDKIDDPKTDRVEAACCSEDGEYIAWCDNSFIKCMRFSDRKIVFEQTNTSRSNFLMISPKSTKIVAYNTMSGGDNLHFWDLNSQQHLLSMPFKKATQWRPVFSMNEDICLQHINGELIIYSGGKFDKPKQKIGHLKISGFSLSTASFAPSQAYQNLYKKRSKIKNHYIAIYTQGSKAQPSIVKIYKYPNITDAVANKSFFKADQVKFSWSPSGNSLLLICSTDFDQTGKSYYGEQSLNFMNVKGDSYFVKLPKEGAISHIEWYPSCDQDMFICVYGLQPAKVSLFNNKCEIIHHFGEAGSYNGALFNPFGTLVAIYGFGNLGGQLCIWDFDKKKLITTVKVPETTGIDWCADGKHILTCTTSPRLRVSNGFRLWHYNGSLLHELIGPSDPTKNIEIYDVVWQPLPDKFSKFKIDSKGPKQPNLMAQSNLNKFQSSAGKYIPPSMRAGASANKPKYLDSAIGIGAGGREIVGLESLSISGGNKSKKANSNNSNKNKKPNTNNKKKNNNNKNNGINSTSSAPTTNQQKTSGDTKTQQAPVS